MHYFCTQFHALLHYIPAPVVRLQQNPNWLGGMTQNNEEYITVPCCFLLFPHYRCIPLIIAAAKNVLITACVRRHCQSPETNIPDRARNACHVNEVCRSCHILAICHQRAGKPGQWVQVLACPSPCPQAEREKTPCSRS